MTGFLRIDFTIPGMNEVVGPIYFVLAQHLDNDEYGSFE